jgi:hypothetical protein
MINISLIMKLILEDIIFAQFGNFILLFMAIVYITGFMLAPICEAEPTKFKMAVLASHVHTTVILLDETRALGTRFGIGFYPSQILAIVTLLFFPDSNHCTGRG